MFKKIIKKYVNNRIKKQKEQRKQTNWKKYFKGEIII